ncbi:MAG: TIR domain-containing protein [Methylotenera sp.]|nr:TIR domain-containing protein [Methylotenera sp.]
MSKKIFISYSHKDETHRSELEVHLAMLKRKNIVSVWHDRKIVAGDEWKNEIDDNLEAADIILFLISPDFLASEYCYDIEVKKAMERHDAGLAKIIPIIVRNCDWHDCEFSKFQAVPKDAKPIVLWNDKDSAWLDVTNGLKAHIANFVQKTIPVEIIVEKEKFQPVADIEEWLDDTEVLLTHRKVTKVRLSDVYVSPDLESENEVPTKEIKIINSDVILKKPDFYLINGEEQQGKTTLLKHTYKQLIDNDYFVIYLSAKEIKSSNLDEIINNAIQKQYKNLSLAQFEAIEKKALLLDNIDSIGLNTKYRNKLIKDFNLKFSFVVTTCDTSFNYISADIAELNAYQRYSLLGFGHTKRAEMVKKWVSLGVEESISDTDLYAQCDDLVAKLDTVIRKNVVPSKPFYILLFLQIFEASTKQNLELTSSGHCYQQLIYQAFDHVAIPKNEIEKYLNVLTELAWAIHKNENGLNHTQLNDFFNSYNNTFLTVNNKETIDKLKQAAIVNEKNTLTHFKYPYLFYFFTAKKIAESFSSNSLVKDEIKVLLSKLHREDYANILVFVTHHTKDSWVLEEIQSVLSDLFSDQKAADLSREQLKFMEEFIAQIPELIIEQREIKEEREKHTQRLDELENQQEDKEFESVDILANINKAFKGMDIAGQIIRNRHATLTREALFNLASHGALTGLRFLNYFINLSDISKLEIVKFIEQRLSEHPNHSDKDIQKYAEKIFLLLTYNVINVVIRKIASSIGSKEASEIYASLERQENSPAIILLNQAIELHFKKNLDVPTISEAVTKLKGNQTCLRILKEIVVQHTYMFPINYKEKQQLSELLGISVEGQRIMDSKKIAKGL